MEVELGFSEDGIGNVVETKSDGGGALEVVFVGGGDGEDDGDALAVAFAVDEDAVEVEGLQELVLAHEAL